MTRACRSCSAPLSKAQVRFCSKTCVGKSRAGHLKRIAMSGGMAKKTRKTPRKTSWGTCPVCSGAITTRRATTCSRKCKGLKASAAHTSKKTIPNKSCVQCGAGFHSYRKQRMFCSYDCHLKNGGAFRAGVAATAERIASGRFKKDKNHDAIFSFLKRRGIKAFDFSGIGKGIPDGAAWVVDRWHLFEVKNPETGYGKRGLNPIQIKWMEQWQGGPCYILRTEQDAARFCNGEFSSLEMQRSAIVGSPEEAVCAVVDHATKLGVL